MQKSFMLHLTELMKKCKDKLHKFKFDIYPCEMWITISKDNFKGILENVKDFGNDDLANVDCAYQIKNGVGIILVRFKNKSIMNFNTVTHESLHVAINIFSYIGEPIDVNHQEAIAYLAGYIAECCGKVKNYKPKKKKNV